jgi:hypothetical protein
MCGAMEHASHCTTAAMWNLARHPEGAFGRAGRRSLMWDFVDSALAGVAIPVAHRIEFWRRSDCPQSVFGQTARQVDSRTRRDSYAGVPTERFAETMPWPTMLMH